MTTKNTRKATTKPKGKSRSLALGTGSALRETIARIIMDQFWGELPPGYDWETEASTLGVTVSDTDKGNETVLELTDKVIAALPNIGHEPRAGESPSMPSAE